MSARLAALLVDAVGTIVRLREPAAVVYVRVAARHRIARALPDVARALAAARIGPPDLDGIPLAEIPAREREGWRAIVRQALGDPAADGPCFDAIYREYALPGAWQLVPGVREALAAARAQGLRCAVVSNMDARLPELLAGLELSDAFDALFLPSTCGLAKPDARIFALAAEKLGASPASALYVGDREVDCVAAARAAGLRALRLDPDAPEDSEGRLAGWSELTPRLASFARAVRSG